MIAALRRIWGLMYRHFCLYRRSWPRLLELAYWPTLELLIWGFTAKFVVQGHADLPVRAAGALIGGVLLWEVALRAQMGVTISFLEEIWSRNLGHVFVSPLRRKAGALSAGQKTRVALAKALINRPALILLDEPTASLDPDTADYVRTGLERYRDETGAAILLASHNMAEVERLCAEVLMMKGGRIVDRGTPAGLIARYGRGDLEQVFLAIARGTESRAS